MIIYVNIDADGHIVDASTVRNSDRQIETADASLASHPSICWVYRDGEFVLRDDAEVLKAEFYATIDARKKSSVPTTLSPAAFKRRFTLTERTTISVARSKRTSTDPQELQLALALDIFFEDLDDPRLLEMDLTDQTVTEGLSFLASVGIITAERAVEIGTP